MKKAILLFILCLCAGTAQAKVHCGKWQENIRWSYDTKTKVLVVSGRGAIAQSLGHSRCPGWEWYAHKIKKVKIKEGITKISTLMAGAGAFSRMTRLELPETVREIDSLAFTGSISLKRIKFPSGLKTIGNSAFESSGLVELKIPSGVKKVSRLSFSGAENLKKAIFSEGVETIEGSAFWSCEKLTRVKLPKSLKKIGAGCFCVTGLKKVVIPENVEVIGNRAFVQYSVEKSPLRRVVIKSKKIRKWGKDIFDDAGRDLVIEVPRSRLRSYEAALREKGLPDYVKVVGRKSLD